MHNKTVLVACCAGFYDLQAALLSRLLEAKPIAFLARGDHSNYSLETYLTIDKIQRYSFLSMSATLLSLYKGWLCFSVAHGFPKARFFYAALRMVDYCSTVTPTN